MKRSMSMSGHVVTVAPVLKSAPQGKWYAKISGGGAQAKTLYAASEDAVVARAVSFIASPAGARLAASPPPTQPTRMSSRVRTAAETVTVSDSDSDSDPGNCLKCGTAPPTLKFHPCGHVCMCAACVRKEKGDPRCPRCRMGVAGMEVVPVYVPPMARLLSEAEAANDAVTPSQVKASAGVPVPTAGRPVRCACGEPCTLHLAAKAGRLWWKCAPCCRFKAWAVGPSDTGTRALQSTAVYCGFCNQQCVPTMSSSPKNPGKFYWKCPPGGLTKNGHQCSTRFVLWAQ